MCVLRGATLSFSSKREHTAQLPLLLAPVQFYRKPGHLGLLKVLLKAQPPQTTGLEKPLVLFMGAGIRKCFLWGLGYRRRKPPEELLVQLESPMPCIF